MNYIYAAIAIIIALVVLKFILKLSIKIFTALFIITALALTVTVAVIKPKMHKEFNFNIIEKMLKFNDDGSATIIETTTTNQRVSK
ncbi:hypothetical protein IJS77_02610 [bacterium]|nr:hypothetical protein [bacterium]